MNTIDHFREVTKMVGKTKKIYVKIKKEKSSTGAFIARKLY